MSNKIEIIDEITDELVLEENLRKCTKRLEDLMDDDDGEVLQTKLEKKKEELRLEIYSEKEWPDPAKELQLACVSTFSWNASKNLDIYTNSLKETAHQLFECFCAISYLSNVRIDTEINILHTAEPTYSKINHYERINFGIKQSLSIIILHLTTTVKTEAMKSQRAIKLLEKLCTDYQIMYVETQTDYVIGIIFALEKLHNTFFHKCRTSQNSTPYDNHAKLLEIQKAIEKVSLNIRLAASYITSLIFYIKCWYQNICTKRMQYHLRFNMR